jgi:Na+/H+ antiporter NhaD/arsenite permease-like protein
MISVLVLASVFALIVFRRIGRYRLQIWQVMSLGAAAVLLTGQIGALEAVRSVNIDVMLFLFGVFVIGEALEESGYLAHISSRLFSRSGSLELLVLAVLFGGGALAALLMNDTLAIIGTPVMLLIAGRNERVLRTPKLLLLSLAFGVTIGSVASPIGNPQNLLVALNGGIADPFATFLKFLLVPTMVNLLIAYWLLRLFFRKQFTGAKLEFALEPVTDRSLAGIAKVSLGILLGLILVKVGLVLFSVGFDLRLTYVALAAAAPIVLFSRERFNVVRRIDWHTLVFFATMFILMRSVWDSGFFQGVIDRSGQDLAATGTILAVSTVLSQFISNVPLVALYLPVLAGAGATTAGMMALAAGSTIAGNLTVLGAASNVIIIQNAEKKGNQTLNFWEFLKVGLPLTVLNIAVYWLYFLLVR